MALINGLPTFSADVTQHVGQLNIHLRKGFLHALDVPPSRPYQVAALPPVGPQRANFLRRPK
jgi:hypothetical protein